MTNDEGQNDAGSDRPLNVCRECEFIFEGERCPLCGSTTTLDSTSSAIRAGGERQQRTAQTFSLSTLFLFVTLAAVCFGVMAAEPGLGILLAVISVPALIRASAMAARKHARGRQLPASERIALFAGSLGVMVLIGVAGCAAFFAACFVTCPIAMSVHDWGALFWLAVFAGIVAATVMAFLLYRTWPRR